MKKHIIIGIFCTILLLFGSCKKYLDQKPDLTKVVPSTLADCQALLDDYPTMNASYPDHGEIASDDYYLTDATWNGLGSQKENQDTYVWTAQGQHTNQWLNCYKVVYNANLVLQVLEKFQPSDANYNNLKGSALFFRAFSFYQIAELFTKPYKSSSASTDPGIPLRLSPDLNVKSERGTLKATYDRIIQDLNDAISLLPANSNIPTRPNKAAAYAILARVYLTIGDFANAGTMANECLKLHNSLIDYNQTSTVPTATTVRTALTGASFVRFNAEVIFQSLTVATILTQSQAKINPDLYNSYNGSDRRKTVFFQANTGANSGTYAFRGSYDGSTTAQAFNGVSTNEVYLIRAECYARLENVSGAMADLNTLLKNRMIPPFTDRTATDARNALDQILAERRKELVFRTLRWSDLRRLNNDQDFAITLTRNMNTIPYEPLVPNDLRYAMLIPLQVINTTGMEQNKR